MYQVHVVENGLQAKEKIDELVTSGYTKDDVYLFAHDKNRSKTPNREYKYRRCRHEGTRFP
ncbi:hypothetical protein ABIE66_005516 [Peribacillus sp. B2I2]